jgi:hypothetical protein
MPDLEGALRHAAALVTDEAATLGSLAPLISDLDRSEQFSLLRRLADLGRQLRATSAWLCHHSDGRARR